MAKSPSTTACPEADAGVTGESGLYEESGPAVGEGGSAGIDGTEKANPKSMMAARLMALRLGRDTLPPRQLPFSAELVARSSSV